MYRWIRSSVGFRGCMVAVFLCAVALIVATPHLVEGQSIGEQNRAAVKIDARTYSEVQSLRHTAGLTDEDLATMDLTEDQAADVLGRLLAWTERNRARLDAAEAEVRRASHELSTAQVALNVGPRDERLIRSIPTQARAVFEAESQKRTLQEEAGRQALGGVGSGPQALWEAVNTRPPAGLVLSERQQQLAADFRAAKSSPAADPGGGGRFSSESLQRTRMREARFNRLAGVRAAADRVLPVPEEWTQAMPHDVAGSSFSPREALFPGNP